MSLTSSTRLALKTFASTAGRRSALAAPQLHLPSTSLFVARPISSTPSLWHDAPLPPKFIFPPNFFISLDTPDLIKLASALKTARDEARSFPAMDPLNHELLHQRFLIKNLTRALNVENPSVRTAFLKDLDSRFDTPSRRVLRRKEKARRQIANGLSEEEDKLTMEEWDEKSEREMEEKVAKMEGTEEEKDKSRKRIQKRQADWREQMFWRKEVRLEMEEEEKAKGKGEDEK